LGFVLTQETKTLQASNLSDLLFFVALLATATEHIGALDVYVALKKRLLSHR
jgi:hypothetical protein